MKAMITLPAEILYVRFASITAWMLAEIFAESLNAKESAAEFCHAFELSVSEAFTNAVRYAEPPEAEKKITITFSSQSNQLTVSVSDTNAPFKLDTPAPDISSYPEKGFGLFLIRQLMDTVSYSRQENINLISMTKRHSIPSSGNT